MKLLLFFGAAILAVSMAKEQTVKVSGEICCMTVVKEDLPRPDPNQSKGQENIDWRQFEIEYDDCEESKKSKNGKTNNDCNVQKVDTQQTQVKQQRQSRQIQKTICVAPKTATVELWDHSKIFPDKFLEHSSFENKKDYAFNWDGDRFATVDPLLKVRVDCQDGRTVFKTFEHFEKTDVQQNIVVS